MYSSARIFWKRSALSGNEVSAKSQKGSFSSDCSSRSDGSRGIINECGVRNSECGMGRKKRRGKSGSGNHETHEQHEKRELKRAKEPRMTLMARIKRSQDMNESRIARATWNWARYPWHPRNPWFKTQLAAAALWNAQWICLSILDSVSILRKFPGFFERRSPTGVSTLPGRG